jgi:hypothetical protein
MKRDTKWGTPQAGARLMTGGDNIGSFGKPMILAPSTYIELLSRVAANLGPDRRFLLVGIDGRDGGGKTSAANWLAWQLGMPTIHLDLFVKRTESEGPISWRTDDVARCLESRGARPIIVERVLLLDALSEVQRKADFLIFVEKILPQRGRDRSSDDDLIDTREFSLGNQISRYFERRKPLILADFKLFWNDVDYDLSR